MTRKIVFLLLFLLGSKHFYAQNNVYLGVKGGGKTTIVTSDKFGDKTYSRLGFVSGISAEYLINYRIGFNVGVLYKQVGFGTNINLDPNIVLLNNQTVISQLHYDYISIPLKFRFCPIPKSRGYGWLIDLGVSYSSLVQNQQITEVFDEGYNSVQISHISDHLIPNKNYLSGLIEVSTYLPLNDDSNWNLTLSGTYEYCFKNLSNDNFLPNRIIKFNEVTFCAGIAYKL